MGKPAGPTKPIPCWQKKAFGKSAEEEEKNHQVSWEILGLGGPLEPLRHGHCYWCHQSIHCQEDIHTHNHSPSGQRLEKRGNHFIISMIMLNRRERNSNRAVSVRTKARKPAWRMRSQDTCLQRPAPFRSWKGQRSHLKGQPYNVATAATDMGSQSLAMRDTNPPTCLLAYILQAHFLLGTKAKGRWEASTARGFINDGLVCVQELPSALTCS